MEPRGVDRAISGCPGTTRATGATITMRRPRSTPEGQHRPVLLAEVLEVLRPAPGEVAVDCTTGWAGHAAELLARVGASGRLVGLDLDAENLPRARPRLEEVGHPFSLHH